MAQTGYTPISIYYSSTTTNVPTAGNLVAGELALNTADGKLFYKDSSNVVQVIGTKGGVGSSTTTQVLYNSSGLVVGSANLTFNGTTLTLANDASISGLTVGKGSSALGSNTAFGVSALNANTTGNQNTAIGYQAGILNTTGTGNTGIGSGANYSVTTGINNSALGQNALNNSTGSYNTALGTAALALNTTASNNTAVGYQAGYSQTSTGNPSVLIGYKAGYAATVGDNCLVGVNSGVAITTGASNAIFGNNSGSSLTTGVQNTFVGSSNGATGSSGQFITTGSKNTILGNYTGNQGGLDIRTASNYIVLSDGDGNPRGIFDNAGKFLVGRTASGLSNTTGVTIGDGGIGLQSEGNTVQIYLNRTTSDGVITSFRRNNTEVGSIAVTTVLTTYNTTSDYRLKTVIAPVIDAGQRLDALKPIEYDWKVGGRTRGFLAHQFAEVYPTSVSGEKDAVDEDGKPVYQAMQASTPEVMADLVAEIQSLRKRVALLESK